MFAQASHETLRQQQQTRPSKSASESLLEHYLPRQLVLNSTQPHNNPLFRHLHLREPRTRSPFYLSSLSNPSSRSPWPTTGIVPYPFSCRSEKQDHPSPGSGSCARRTSYTLRTGPLEPPSPLVHSHPPQACHQPDVRIYPLFLPRPHAPNHASYIYFPPSPVVAPLDSLAVFFLDAIFNLRNLVLFQQKKHG